MERCQGGVLRQADWKVVCVALLLSALHIPGCGSGQQASITGKAAFRGEPIAEGTLRFSPVGETSGQPVGASINEGVYRIPENQGLSPGEYRVSITAYRSTGRKIRNEEPLAGEPKMIEEKVQYIPDDFNRRTTLRVRIDAGPNEHDFALGGS